MTYFDRLKEIQKLQWELFIDYWYVHIGLIIVGLVIVIWWVLRK
ncbi:hypothetical protein [Ornithinibacillus halotolerans]|uniref:Uncharacterized protein n=1 Tax=Ornithinibacillus halotolerans TaxID=1274357 RepID=A0A916S2I3_9BACI|nr:hypothetical protein [Ornithinibacillus halotolerans]GGA80547.1 hypothetical protein GCM10008025_24960 [Ornithinibacillus halotolerans]